MGFERYCYICGCPFGVGFMSDVVIDVSVIKKYFPNYKMINKQDWWKIQSYYDEKKYYDFAINFNIPVENAKKIINAAKDISAKKKYKWLYKVMILKNDKIIPLDVTIDSWDGYFINKEGSVSDWGNERFLISKDPIKTGSKYMLKQEEKLYGARWDNGYLMHQNCYKILKTKYGNFMNDDISTAHIKHPVVEKYQYQDFWTQKLFVDNNEFILENPLINDKNRKRILSIKFPIKIKKHNSKKLCIKSTLKKYTERAAPPYPANNCPNQIMIGNDGLKYKSIENKNGVYTWKKV